MAVDTRFAGTRKNPDLCGSITQITTENFNPGELTHALLCGMAQELYDMYKKMGEDKSGIVGSGNGVRKNEALVRIFEEKFAGKMKMPAHLEEAAVGAAFFALVAGKIKTVEDIHKMTKYL